MGMPNYQMYNVNSVLSAISRYQNMMDRDDYNILQNALTTYSNINHANIISEMNGVRDLLSSIENLLNSQKIYTVNIASECKAILEASHTTTHSIELCTTKSTGGISGISIINLPILSQVSDMVYNTYIKQCSTKVVSSFNSGEKYYYITDGEIISGTSTSCTTSIPQSSTTSTVVELFGIDSALAVCQSLAEIAA